MRHLSEGELQSWIDGEMDAPSKALAQEHLAACAECRSALGEQRRTGERFSEAMHAHDGAIASRGAFVDRHVAARVARKGTFGLGRAAAIVLLAAAGAAAVVPGGPLRQLWDGAPSESEPSAIESIEGPRADREAATRPGTSITVHPVDGALRVDVTGFSPGTVVIASLTRGGSATASLPPWAENARFIVSSGNLRIVSVARGSDAPSIEADPIRLRFPDSLREGVLSVEGVAVARVDDGELSAAAGRTQTVGDEMRVIIGG